MSDCRQEFNLSLRGSGGGATERGLYSLSSLSAPRAGVRGHGQPRGRLSVSVIVVAAVFPTEHFLVIQGRACLGISDLVPATGRERRLRNVDQVPARQERRENW